MDAKTTERMCGWVGDLHALEGHVEQALDEQVQMEPRSAEVAAAFAFFSDTVRGSRARLATHLEAMDGGEPSRLADSLGEWLGAAAGIVDRARATTVARSVRDDYVAFSSIKVGYEMLLTTALATGHVSTARVAELALRDYAACLMRANDVLALATMDDLQSDADVTVVNTGVEGAVRAAIDRAWAAA